MTLTLLERIDNDLKITVSIDPEINQRWFPLSIALGYQYAFEYAHKFISWQGRMKYLSPVYQTLWDYGYQTIAYAWFNENIDFYHPIAV